MIIETREEQLLGCNKVKFDELQEKAYDIRRSFIPYTLDWSSDAP